MGAVSICPYMAHNGALEGFMKHFPTRTCADMKNAPTVASCYRRGIGVEIVNPNDDVQKTRLRLS